MDTGGDEDCGHWGGGVVMGGVIWGVGSLGGGVTTMKRWDEDWSLGGGSLEGVGWWSLEGVVVMGGVFTGGGGVVVTGGAHNEDRDENAKNEEEEDHSEDRGWVHGHCALSLNLPLPGPWSYLCSVPELTFAWALILPLPALFPWSYLCQCSVHDLTFACAPFMILPLPVLCPWSYLCLCSIHGLTFASVMPMILPLPVLCP